MHDVQQFVELSRRAGERLDMVQAGGGNSSYKLEDGTMLIKASGVSLSEVGPDKGYARVGVAEVRAVLEHPEVLAIADKRAQDARAAELMREAVREPAAKPSIETFLHALMGRVTLHTHPTVVNAVTCRPDWAETLGSLFPAAILVPYETPGIKLAFLLKERLASLDTSSIDEPQVVFLQNHGLIVSAANTEAVLRETERVMSRLEALLGLDMGAYRSVSELSGLIEHAGVERPVVYRSCDAELKEAVRVVGHERLARHFCPDGFVYCGYEPVVLASLSDKAPVARYVARYAESPKVLLVQEDVYVAAANIRKAKEIEDVFKFHVTVLRHAGSDVQSLPGDEIAYLAGWDAEKYRQKL